MTDQELDLPWRRPITGPTDILHMIPAEPGWRVLFAQRAFGGEAGQLEIATEEPIIGWVVLAGSRFTVNPVTASKTEASVVEANLRDFDERQPGLVSIGFLRPGEGEEVRALLLRMAQSTVNERRSAGRRL